MGITKTKQESELRDLNQEELVTTYGGGWVLVFIDGEWVFIWEGGD